MKISLFEIFKIFFIIGLQLLGGGYVIVPLLQKYIVDERKWMSSEELIDFFAMSQCIPGIIAGKTSVPSKIIDESNVSRLKRNAGIFACESHKREK